jgi:hypothetical protein
LSLIPPEDILEQKMISLRPADEADLSALLQGRTTPLRLIGGGTRTLWFGKAADVLDCSAL